MKVVAYTDGSACAKGKCTCEKSTCPKCNRLGGLGSYIKFGDKREYISKGYKNTTVSRMEMKALLYTIEKMPENKSFDLIVYSDSQFVVNAFNKKWLENWRKENFLARKNSDIWKQIDNAINKRSKMNFTIIHTRGHRKDLDDPIAKGNNIADKLCSYKNFTQYECDKNS